MKKYTQPNRTDLWSAEDIQFLRDWYGKVKPMYLADILKRSKDAVYNQTRIHSIKAHAKLYGAVEIVYKGKRYPAKGPRYKCERTETGYNHIDTQRVYKRTPSVKKSVKEVKETREPPRKEARPNLKQNGNVRPFETAGKQLVQLDKKTWVYR